VPPVAHHHRLTPWTRLVAVSAVLVVGLLIVLGVMAIASQRERIVSYPVRGELDGLSLDLGDADVVIARGGRRPAVEIDRREHYAFGHSARTVKQVAGGTFRLRSRCPATVLHDCSVSYRVIVPDNVPIDVRTGGGSVRLDGYRGSAKVATGSGDVSINDFCGFSLQARAQQGAISASVPCALQQLSLRSTSGSVRVAVPPGRYRLDAETAAGQRTVRGVTDAADAPFALQALSSSGDVLVEGRS
jgi:Putative adhesin